MKSKLFIYVVISFTICFLLSFQSDEEQNATVIDQSRSMPQNGWYFFNKNAKIESKNVFVKHKDVFGLASDDEMILFKESKTEIPNETFYKYQQYYKGIRVLGAVMLVKSNDNILELVHGKIIKNLDINVNPNITELQALNNALKKINASEYAW